MEVIDPIYVLLDSNQYIQCAYNCNSGKLGNLKKYCNQGLVKLIITDVIIEEVKAHIKDDIYEFDETRKKELSKARVLSAVRNNISFEYLFKDVDIKNLIFTIDQQFEEYINDINVIIIDNKMINIDTVLENYFSIKPPFEKTKKRNEFKDAFIINALKNYREKEKISIHIISSDSGFCKAFENNSHFVIHKELSDFFKFMNDKCHKEVYEDLERYLKLPAISKRIKEETYDFLENCTVTIYDDIYGVYTNEMFIDIEYEGETFSKVYFEEVNNYIIAHMELECTIEVNYDITNQYMNPTYHDQIIMVEKTSSHSIVKNFEIEFGLLEDEGGLHINRIGFENDHIKLNETNLLDSKLEFYNIE